jgi:hypothetical protein
MRVLQEQDFFGKYVRKCADDAPRSAIFSDVKGKVYRVEIRSMKHSSRPKNHWCEFSRTAFGTHLDIMAHILEHLM